MIKSALKDSLKLFFGVLVLATILASLDAFGQLSQMTYSAGVKSFKNYVKNPDCAKNVLNITASGGSFAKGTTTPLNADTGSECTIDASSSGQTYTWALSTLGQDLKGKNCEARFVFEGDASLYKAYVKNGSSQITADLQLTYPTYSRDVSINVPCGDLSASNTVVIESTSASAAAISVAQVYFGEATNTTQVAQAQFIGSAYIASTGGCNWDRTNTAFGSFSTIASCPGPTVEFNSGPGIIQTTDTDLPKFTVNSLPPGNYRVLITGYAYSTTINLLRELTINDGTTSSGAASFQEAVASTDVHPVNISGNFVYTSAGNRTFELYGRAATSGSINLYNTSASSTQGLRFEIYRYPSSSEIALRQNNTPWYVDATMDGANPSLGVASVSSYTEIIDAGLTLRPQTGSQPVGVMCSTTNAATAPTTSTSTCAAGSESLGINFAIPEAGTYEVCFYGNHSVVVDTGEEAHVTFQLIETPTNAQTLTLEGGTRTQSGVTSINIATGTAGGVSNPMSNCSMFNWTSSGTKGVRLMYEQTISGTPNSSLINADLNSTVGQRNIKWTVKPITRQIPMTLLVGSVTSNTSGMERVERATIASAGTISSQSGTWLAVSSKGTGVYTWTSTGLSSGFVCMCNPSGNSTGKCIVDSYGTNTFRSVLRDSGGTLADTVHEIICMGPR